jgi:hypothetical protein
MIPDLFLNDQGGSVFTLLDKRDRREHLNRNLRLPE